MIDVKALTNVLYNEVKKDKEVEAVFSPSKFNLRGGGNRLFVQMKDGTSMVVKISVKEFAEGDDQ